MTDTQGTDNTEPPNAGVSRIIEQLKRAIWQRRPILGEIMKKHGDKTIYRYAQDFMDVNPAPHLDSRKQELITTAQQLLAFRLGKEVAAGVAKQLTKLPLVSTADHHGPIDHPLWVNSNIISAIPFFQNVDPDIQYLIAFSFASVSLNNASAYPRGIEFHGGVNGSGNFIRLPILPDKLKMGVVYGTRSFTREDLTKAEAELMHREKAGELIPGRGEKIREIVESFFGRPDVLNAADLSMQITEINYNFWPKLFHGPNQNGGAPKKGKKMPDLIYLEIETLVTELLLSYHFKNPRSLIHRLLFTPEYRALTLEYFNNLAGGFSLEHKWGTYMFWAVDEKQHRVKMELNGDSIYSQERGYVYTYAPETLAAALREKKIFPSMLLCYLVVSLYYGMKCLGGFCQVHDLTVIKEAWQKFLRVIGEKEEADGIVPIQTKELGGDGLVLAYLRTAQGDTVPATGIDMVLETADDTSYEKYVELSKKVTLTEMMNPMLTEMYTVLYSSHQRDPALLAVTPEQILKETGLEKKLVD